MKIYLASFVLALALVGCAPEPDSVVEERQTNYVLTLLPPKSTIVEKLGDKWFVVEINIDEQPKRFLFGYWYGSHSEVGMTLTELSK
jgi:hypothetical protein